MGGLVLAAGAMVAAPVELQFAGVDASEATVRVSLVETRTKERGWVAVGGRFAGCEVKSYDAARRMLTLARGGETWELALQDGTIASSKLSAEETERVSIEVLANLRQLAAAADQYYLENGATVVTFDKLVGGGPNHYIKELKRADGEDYTKLDLRHGGDAPEWVIVTARGVEVRYKRH